MAQDIGTTSIVQDAVAVAQSAEEGLAAGTPLYLYERKLREGIRVVEKNDPRRALLLAERAVVNWQLRTPAMLADEQHADRSPFVPRYVPKDAADDAAADEAGEGGGDDAGDAINVMEELDQSALPYLRARAAATGLVMLRARLLDVVFLSGERGLEDDVIRAYFCAARAVPNTQYAAHSLARGAVRAVRQRPQPEHAQALKEIVSEQRKGAAGFLYDTVRAGLPLMRRDKSLASEVLKLLLDAADEAAQKGGEQRDVERRALLAAIEVADVLRKAETKAALRARHAASFEKEADERDPSLATVFLEFALEAFKKLGDSSAVERLKRRVHEAGERATAHGRAVTATGRIPRALLDAEIDRDLEVGLSISEHAHIGRIALSLWPPWAEVRKGVMEAREHYLFMHLPVMMFTTDGRPSFGPAGEDAQIDWQMRQRFVDDTKLVVQVIAAKVRLLRERGRFDALLIEAALAEGMAFGERELTAIRPGLVDFDAGRFWSALHVLVPQIERVLRRLADKASVDTRRIPRGKQELHWASLTQLLKDERLGELLALASPDLATQLATLLVDSMAGNLRDDLAHGILPASAPAEGLSLLAMLILVTLSGFRADGAVSSAPQDGTWLSQAHRARRWHFFAGQRRHRRVRRNREES